MRWDANEWRKLRDLVSPSFFDVLPAADLRRQLGELARNAVHRAEFEQAREALALGLQRTGLPIRVGRCPTRTDTDFDRRGEAVLELFFHQLFHHETAVLDVRAARFHSDGHTLFWNPRPLWVRWDPGFLDAVRNLYVGFYEEDDGRFRDALSVLGLACAEPTFRAHFGGNSLEATKFAARDFRSAFHDTFVTCRATGASLHPGFVPLGAYLACLYEHLEQLGGSYDVRAAFRSARDG